jgi:FtsZ-binding cell division protein ZapB
LFTENLKRVEEFYQRKISELQQDKEQLRRKESADQAHIADLVGKYQLLEKCMRKVISQSKKRNEL